MKSEKEHGCLIDASMLMQYCQNQQSKTIDCNDIARFPIVVPVDNGERMTNQQWLATISPEEWLRMIDWLYHEYGKCFTDSETAIKEWLKSDKETDSGENTQGD